MSLVAVKLSLLEIKMGSTSGLVLQSSYYLCLLIQDDGGQCIGYNSLRNPQITSYLCVKGAPRSMTG